MIEVKLSLAPDSGEDIMIQRKVTEKDTKVTILPEGYDISHITSDIEIPIFNFNEFVGQTANKLKEYFIKNILPTTDGELNWPQILTESILDCNFQDRDAIIAYGLKVLNGLDGDVLDQVVTANKRFKEEQSFNKAELQRLQGTVTSLIYYDDYAGPTNVDEINSQIIKGKELRDQWIRYNSATEATKSAQEELAKLTANMEKMGGKESYDRLVAALPAFKDKYTKVSEVISGKQKELAAVKNSIAAADGIIKSNGICPYTKDSCKSIQAKIEDLRNETVTSKATAVTLSEEINAKTAELNDLNLKIRKCESKISDFMKIWDRIETLKKLTSDLPQKPDTDKDIYALNAELEMLEQSLNKLQANIRYNETIESITKRKYEVELQAKALTNWVKKTDTNGLQTTLMLAPFEELSGTMTEYIQRMYANSDLKAHFNVSSKSNSFSFGLVREGNYIPYDLLSSGEKCLYSLALMICIVNKCKSPLKVLLLDDAFDHLDSHTIETTFATLKNVEGIQFIFAGVKECKNAADIVLKV
jgi:predicted  nucleic acid-binding Zn-ribbon protein